jgi:hypothetical protein
VKEWEVKQHLMGNKGLLNEALQPGLEARDCEGGSWTTSKAAVSKGWSPHRKTLASDHAPQYCMNHTLAVWGHRLSEKRMLTGDWKRPTRAQEASKSWRKEKSTSVITPIPCFTLSVPANFVTR